MLSTQKGKIRDLDGRPGPVSGELLQQATEPGRLRQRGVVRPEVVQEMIAEHRAGKRDRTWHLWGLVVLESWFQQRIDQLELPSVDLSRLQPEVWPDRRE